MGPDYLAAAQPRAIAALAPDQAAPTARLRTRSRRAVTKRKSCDKHDTGRQDDVDFIFSASTSEYVRLVVDRKRMSDAPVQDIRYSRHRDKQENILRVSGRQ